MTKLYRVKMIGLVSKYRKIVKLVLETTCIKQSTALRQHCSETTPEINVIEPAFKDHLLSGTTFIASLGWSLNTSYAVS